MKRHGWPLPLLCALVVLVLAAAAGPARADAPDAATRSGPDAGRAAGIRPAQTASQARVFLPIVRRDTPDFADGRFRARSVAPGLLHTCAVDLDGALWCWGLNLHGALGVGSDDVTLRSSWPRQVTGFGEALSSVATTAWGSCALTASGGVWCWGDNRCGQLGEGGQAAHCDSRPPSPAPLPVHGLPGPVRALALGLNHACALTESGAVWCWGRSSKNYDMRPTPYAVAGLESGVMSISAGAYHNCALLASGAAKCWGWFKYGGLEGSETPTSPPGWETGVQQVAEGASHVCALRTNGAVECFGENDQGQLGLDSTVWPIPDPRTVLGLPAGVKAITAGGAVTCALLADGALWCWGWNESGQLGVGRRDLEPQPRPQRVEGLAGPGIEAMTSWASPDLRSCSEDAPCDNDWGHTCARLADGRLQCWGANHSGQLGDGSFLSRPLPGDVREEPSGQSGGGSRLGMAWRP
jgi:alpha-tubulin suppressor-like RCC1 family protein